MTSVAVLGDIHGNARALRAALDQARRGPMDHLVLLGDLLTYGHDVAETLALVSDAQARHDAILLKGNHDQLYLDLDRGDHAYVDKLPAWIRDSVDLTRARLDVNELHGLDWREEHILDGVLFSHANPFGTGDWTYLNHPPELEEARVALAQRGLRAGVFGHTHRPYWGGGAPIVGNAGSVGQPRDSRAESVLLRLVLSPEAVTASFEPIAYDVQAHVATLEACGLGESTIARLAGFFARRDPA